MRECTVCGDKDFEEHDGHYFCATCNTQSQDARVIVADEENFDNFRRSGLIREPSTPKQSKQSRVAADRGRPWSVYEAYQIIIQHQVDALIKLGAQESLRDIVFQIWVNYLSKLGVAFSKEAVNKVKYERQRELFPSTTEHPEIRNVLGKRSLKKTLGPSAKRVQQQIEKDKTVEALQNEEFYKEDNPLNESEDTESGSQGAGWSSSEEDETEKKWGRYRKSLKYNAVEKVRMTSTVAVCFLGLMYTNPLTTATDLIRWIQDKKVPYLDVRGILPEDMKFCLNDWKLFGFGSPPTLEQLRYTAGTIAYYIGLKNFPEFPLDDLINKYVILLDLPAEFHGYAINVCKGMQIYLRYIPSVNQKLTIHWEAIAMAYIVVLLKLFFGFNDSNEMLMSEYSKELSEISECAKPLFIWTDWVQHMKNRMQIEEQEKLKIAKKRLVCDRLRNRIEMNEYKGRERKFQKSFRESVVKPFEELSRSWEKETSKNRQSSTLRDHFQADAHDDTPIDFDVNTLDDDPLEVLQLDDSRENDWNTWGNQSASNNKGSEVNREIRQRSDHFRKSTVQHLLNPETYFSDIQNNMEADSSQQESSKGGSDFCLSEVIISDVYQGSRSCSKKRRKEHSNLTGSQRSFNILDDENSALHDKMEKYQLIIEKLKELRQYSRTSLHFETEVMCLSYDWLIKICCHMIQCETDQLKNMIYKLELMFFSDPEDDCLSRLARHQRKRLRSEQQYFANYIVSK